MLTGPSASGKTTSAHKVAEALEASGTPAHVISLDNFFKGAQYYPRLPDGTLDYENPDTLDMPLIRQCLSDLSTTGLCHRVPLLRDGGAGPRGRRLHRGGHPRPEP